MLEMGVWSVFKPSDSGGTMQAKSWSWNAGLALYSRCGRGENIEAYPTSICIPCAIQLGGLLTCGLELGLVTERMRQLIQVSSSALLQPLQLLLLHFKRTS